MSITKRNLFKIIATSLVGFFSITTGVVLCKTEFIETKAETATATIQKETFGKHHGEALTATVKVVSNNDLTIKTEGVNTISSTTATSYYGYLMFTKNAGFIYSNNAISGYYPSNITATFSGGTGTSGKVQGFFNSSALTTRNSSCSGSVTKNGTYTIDNSDSTKTYWNLSSTTANVQIVTITVTYTKSSVTPPPATHDVAEITGESTVKVGETITLTTSCSQNDTITWSSGTPSVATVNNSGVVTGVSAGTSVITATCAGGDSATKTITVTDNGGGDTPPTPPTPSGYYSSITTAQIQAGGQTLLNALRTLNSSKKTKNVGYNAMGTNVKSSKYIYTDYDIDTATTTSGVTTGTEIVSFYTGETMPETENFSREHVWPASRLPGGRDDNVVDDDILMTRPASMTANGDRSNKYYSETGAANTSDPGMYQASYRGDAARIIFYTVLLDTNLGIDSFNDNPSTVASDCTMGNLSEMLRWNYEYPVLDRELRRNAGAEYLQGNRNPFVDHPEWIPLIFGQSSDVTTYSNFKGLNICLDNTTIQSSSHKTLTATASDGSAITWTSNNSEIASVNSNGVVTTGTKGGAALITASATINGVKYTKSCVVRVEAPAKDSSFSLLKSDTLVAGCSLIIAASEADKAMSTTQNGNNRGAADITKSGNYASWTGDVCVFTLGGTKNNWTLYDSVNEGYIYFPSGGNYLRTTSSVSNAAKWKITFDGTGKATITNVDTTTRTLQYNKSNTIFACYTTSQQAPAIYASNEPAVDTNVRTVYGDVGENVTINATPRNFPGTATISWTIDDNTVASLSSSSGASIAVNLLKRGNTEITVTATSGSATATSKIGVSVIGTQYESNPLEDAQAWAQLFISSITCDSTGANAPTYVNTSWAALGSSYSALSADAKVYFVNATYSVSGSTVTALNGTDTTIANCVAKYDYIVTKYGASNFMNRTASYNASNIKKTTDNMLPLIISASLLSISLLFAAYSFLRRKEN